MSAFTTAELAYLQGERRLAHLATGGSDGTPHITPVGRLPPWRPRLVEIRRAIGRFMWGWFRRLTRPFCSWPGR